MEIKSKITIIWNNFIIKPCTIQTSVFALFCIWFLQINSSFDLILFIIM